MTCFNVFLAHKVEEKLEFLGWSINMQVCFVINQQNVVEGNMWTVGIFMFMF